MQEHNPKEKHVHHAHPKRRFSESFYNPITYVGVILAALMLFAEIMLFVLDYYFHGSNVYLGIFTYLLLPPFFILGLILIPIGARRRQRRIKLGLDHPHSHRIVIDPTNPVHQNALMIFAVGSVVLIVMTTIGSYKAFHYMESVEFCGTACHDIMKPEHTMYLKSPHANVRCVNCHIGSGAESYFKSKFSGTRMVLKTLNGSYERPVPAPVSNLRPAKDICEQCHWPDKAFSTRNVKHTYFSDQLDDEGKAKRWDLSMVMRLGGRDDQHTGVHAHMYNDHDIYYVAEDDKRQNITWVKSVSKSGEETIYTTHKSPYKNSTPPANKIRKMDCIDCHNRPTHRFQAPTTLLDKAFDEGRIDRTVPQIKAKAMDALVSEYVSVAEASEKITKKLTEYYTVKQSAYYGKHPDLVEAAIKEVVTIYKGNFFPEMKSRWDIYPDNLGHLNSLGCFRCHDEEHRAKSNKVISKDCAICHTITGQGSGKDFQKNQDGLEFQHPFDDDGSWKEMNCTECHTGGS